MMTKRIRFEKASSARAPILPEAASDGSKAGSFTGLVAEIEASDVATASSFSNASIRAGTLVRSMRKSANLSQQQLANKLGVSQARVSEIEAGLGKHGPSWDLMERIADACGREVGLVASEPAIKQQAKFVGVAESYAQVTPQEDAEMRDLAEKSVDTVEGSSQTLRTSAEDMTRKTFAIAEQNISAAFDLAQKLARSKDVQEAMRNQAEYVKTQLASMQEQLKELGTAVQEGAQKTAAEIQKTAANVQESVATVQKSTVEAKRKMI